MTKQEKIEAYLSKPIEVGDAIIYYKVYPNKVSKKKTVRVSKIENKTLFFREEGFKKLSSISINEVEKCVRHIGDDPFIQSLRVNQFAINIDSLISHLGFDREGKVKDGKYFSIDVPEVNFEPFLTDVNGREVVFQRGLEWNELQKKNLIKSIYNGMDIGKFILRNRSFEWVENRVKAGIVKGTAFKDLIDGKQRATAILDFIADKFADHNGIFYSQFSENAKYKFRNFGNMSYGEISDKATDKEVRDFFLNVNEAGQPMKVSHIEFVKNIKI